MKKNEIKKLLKNGWCGCEGYSGCIGCKMQGFENVIKKIIKQVRCAACEGAKRQHTPRCKLGKDILEIVK